MSDKKNIQIQEYSTNIIKGLKWVILVIFFSQLAQFFSIKLFDVSNDIFFIPEKWTFGLPYFIRHVVLGSGIPLITYIIVSIFNKKYPQYNQWFASLYVLFLASHYCFVHWGFNCLANLCIFSILLCCPYENKVKYTNVVLSLVMVTIYSIYQVSSTHSLYDIFILTINYSEIICAFCICGSISKVFTKLIASNIILNKDAYIDKLTGLHNKNSFLTQKIKLTGKSIAFIDLDDFKSINDNNGHDIGDKILKVIATELKTLDNSIAYRFGGDEFVLISHNTGNILKEQLEVVTSRINNKCINIYNIPVTLSIGITTFNDSLPIDEVLRNSDALLYQVKKSGKNNILLDRRSI